MVMVLRARRSAFIHVANDGFEVGVIHVDISDTKEIEKLLECGLQIKFVHVHDNRDSILPFCTVAHAVGKFWEALETRLWHQVNMLFVSEGSCQLRRRQIFYNHPMVD